MLKYICEDLRERIFSSVGEVAFDGDFSLSAHTTIGVGGRAAAFFPDDFEKCNALVKALNEANVPFYILGKGSDVLPPDGDYGAAIICAERLKGIAATENTVFARAGESFSSLIKFGMENRLSFCEFMAGVPASAGGAAYMNAGVNGRHVSDVIKSVTFTDGDGIYTISNEECAFSYKDSVFRHFPRRVILGVEFIAERSERVRENVKTYLSRRANLPSGKSMGCVFKNPEGLFAGKIIEDCGLKGAFVGGAFVSDRHANFIINRSFATSADIKTLVERVKNVVFLKTGITLEEEINYM